jgi:4-amino-4-deoxy-L-arabinose transferase-like glycosyltransferase
VSRRAGSRIRSDRFARWLAGITASGLLVRLVYVIGFRRDNTVSGDPYFYHHGANLLVNGEGFIAPLQFIELNIRMDAADHPPLYMLFLSIPSALGLDTPLAHMLWSALLGTATIVLVGLVGRKVGGTRVGLIAAAIVAVAPNLWIYDGAILSETMAIFAATLVLLLAYRAWEQPDRLRLCVLGAGCGLAMLARSELLLLVPGLLWPVALLARRSPWRVRLAGAGAATIVALVVIAPWVGYNLARFRHPVFLSSQLETTLAGANCPDTYYGDNIGLFTQNCLDLYPHDPGEEESVTAQTLRKGAQRYMRAHLSRIPVVAAARVGRVTGVYRPSQQLDLDVFVEGRERPVAILALAAGYAMELAAIAGALILWRRRELPVFPLVVVPAAVLLTIALTYATDRFRASAETALAVLAAVAIAELWRRARARPVT